jgi:hypothetical protein
MNAWSLSISAAAFLVSIISFYYSRLAWNESNRPLVTARVSSLGMGGNVAIPLSILVENTGTRPAKNIRLTVNKTQLESALAAKESDTLRRQIEACFSDRGFIPVIANGKHVSNSFGVLGDAPTWKEYRLDVDVSYQDLDGRSFRHSLPLKIGEDAGFAGGLWK